MKHQKKYKHRKECHLPLSLNLNYKRLILAKSITEDKLITFISSEVFYNKVKKEMRAKYLRMRTAKNKLKNHYSGGIIFDNHPRDGPSTLFKKQANYDFAKMEFHLLHHWRLRIKKKMEKAGEELRIAMNTEEVLKILLNRRSPGGRDNDWKDRVVAATRVEITRPL